MAWEGQQGQRPMKLIALAAYSGGKISQNLPARANPTGDRRRSAAPAAAARTDRYLRLDATSPGTILSPNHSRWGAGGGAGVSLGTILSSNH